MYTITGGHLVEKTSGINDYRTAVDVLVGLGVKDAEEAARRIAAMPLGSQIELCEYVIRCHADDAASAESKEA